MRTTKEGSIMSNKNFEVLDNGNTRHRLTVTPERITIKLKGNTSDEERQRIISFFTEVANQDMISSYPGRIRGRCKVFRGSVISLQMVSEDKSTKKMFFEGKVKKDAHEKTI